MAGIKKERDFKKGHNSLHGWKKKLNRKIELADLLMSYSILCIGAGDYLH